MKIGIVGAGALGTIFGASLAAEHDVRVLVRDNKTARAIANRGGLAIDDHRPRRVEASHDPQRLASCEVVIVAVKTFATVAALAPLRAHLDRDAIVVSVQNGIDAAERIEYALGHRHAIVAAPTTEAARLLEPGVAVRAAHGSTVLGWIARHAEDRAPLDALARTFSRCDLASVAVDDVRPALWGKLVVNAAINPVTALARVTNGELLERPELFARARTIAREIATLAAREGVVLPFDDPVARVEAVARATATNRSSMLQDLERGRPTEIDAILGVAIRRAEAVGLGMPAVVAAYDEVRGRTTA